MGWWVRGIGIAAVVAAAAVSLGVAPPPEVGRAMVAADHALASEAGAEALRAGGNAVDAAVAAALSAGVVQPAGSGLGGGGFAVIVTPDGARRTVDFREIAPAAARREMFAEAPPDASTVGGLAIAVPAESRGLADLVTRFGRLPHAKVASPAARQAAGARVGAHLAGSLAATRYESVRSLFRVGDRVAVDGDRVARPALKRALERWAATRGEDLHTGAGATAIARAASGAGGVLTEADLASYRPVDREPLVGTYRGYTLVTMAPPSSGGVVLLQALAVLEGYELAALGHNSSDYVHLLSEVLAHAYADRAHHLGDPGFVEVPVGRLLSPERAEAVRRAVWPGRHFPPEHYGPLIAPPRDAGTQHISVVDRSGMAVALTTTINTSFGSGVVPPELGFILNNQMDDFAARPGVPNAFGLVGSEANAIAPGKRPLSSMSPTVVLNADGQVVMSIGASGGSFIISGVLQAFLNVVEFGMDPQEAVAAPRFHHQWQPDVLMLEPGFPRDVEDALRARGHATATRDGFSAVQVVARADDGTWRGGADPRKGGWPARE